MRRSRRAPVIESDSSDNGDHRGKRPRLAESDSSSESDIEKYLIPVGKIDLNSSLFKASAKGKSPQKKGGPSRLESSSEEEPEETVETTDYRIVEQFQAYTKKLEETKRSFDAYEAKRKVSSKKQNLEVSELLALGESKRPESPEQSGWPLTSDEEDSNWEEVEHDEPITDKPLLPSGPIEIQVGMPEHCRKKKGNDLLAALKRRLNRIRKENQVYVHKVHLLCWIAHGNYLNNSLNDPEVLASALSLIPSEKSYPSGRPDLGYLEQALQWYKKIILLKDKKGDVGVPLVGELVKQIAKKSASNYKVYVYIFMAVMRSLGLRCRLALSFGVEPLRPPATELHSLTKEDQKVKEETRAVPKDVKKKAPLVKDTKKTRAVAKGGNEDKKKGPLDEDKKKTRAVPKSQNELAKKAPLVEDKRNTRAVSKKENEAKKISLPVNNKKKAQAAASKVATRVEKQENGLKKNDVKVPKTTKKNEEKTLKEKIEEGKRTGAISKRSHKKDDKVVNSIPEKKEEKGPKSRNKLPEKVPKSGDDAAPRSTRSLSQKLLRSRGAAKVPQLDGADDETPSKRKTRSSRINFGNLKERSSCTSEDEFSPSNKRVPKASPGPSRGLAPLDVRNDIMRLVKGRIAEQRSLDRRKLVRKPVKLDSDPDSDYAPEPLAKKRHDSDSDLEHFVATPKVKRRLPAKIVSSDDGASPDRRGRKGRDVWAEVFLEAEERWIAVDVARGQLHCVKEIYSRATHPVSYIVAWDNDGAVKDVTMRYCKNFGTVTRKLRVEPKWWEETLRPFQSRDAIRDKEEDDDLARQQLDQPMPKVISEYKDHPLYALRRHLLKFEEIYPPDQVPLGYVRSEPVYPRSCVYVCKSRDIWLKDARVVKLGEKPYKVVKARPKYDKLSNKMVTGQMLEIFGPWQTMEYEPPTAEGGVVPRNAFGNVELFKECMLPKGTIHLRLPGLNKVCRKLNIDCASAVVGFDFHGGWSHPTFDGFVVCEEFADKVVVAWDIEQEEIERKEREKLEARVYGNWKKLIRGLLIRERLNARYNMGKKSETNLK